MTANDDYRSLMEQQHFLDEIEQGIRFANREIIHKYVPELSRDNILALAVAVGKLRARYLEAAFRLGMDGRSPKRTVIKELAQLRLMYEEARNAFDALLDAIQKGYVNVQDFAVEKKLP
ncbi:MAG: hypothetical protein H7841_14260 [Magnetospirillum sp. WYHS-4]